MPGGIPDENCLADLRNGLCAVAIDFAFVTDHPDYASQQSYADLLLSRPNDTVVDGIANRIQCESGHTVLTMPGIEDELMPVGLERQVSNNPDENHRIYNNTDAEALTADMAAGAIVLQAHTESKAEADLLERQRNGLSGTEIFNLHAMLDPDIRSDYLDLEPTSYVQYLLPFMDPLSTIPPDLGFLSALQEQPISLEKWTLLSENAPITGTAGTDAHENVFPSPLGDGERFDSYRRMMGLFSNILLVEGDGPADYKEALRAGRNYVVFEVLGTPENLDVSYGDLEAGGTAAVGGTLHVSCPTLSPTSPQEGESPLITATVYKNSEVFATRCGDYPISEKGLYRVRYEIVPRHLRILLEDQSQYADQVYPWIYSNMFRIGY